MNFQNFVKTIMKWKLRDPTVSLAQLPIAMLRGCISNEKQGIRLKIKKRIDLKKCTHKLLYKSGREIIHQQWQLPRKFHRVLGIQSHSLSAHVPDNSHSIRELQKSLSPPHHVRSTFLPFLVQANL